MSAPGDDSDPLAHSQFIQGIDVAPPKEEQEEKVKDG